MIYCLLLNYYSNQSMIDLKTLSLSGIWVTIILICTCCSYDYNIPNLPESSLHIHTTEYPINFYKQHSNQSEWARSDLNKQIIRIRLGQSPDPFDSRFVIDNVYNYVYSELQSKGNGGSNDGNQFCDVVKITEKSGNYDKYLVSYQLQKETKQSFITTATRSSSIKYDNFKQGQLNSAENNPRVQQVVEEIETYSLTNLKNLHVTRTRIEQLSVEGYQGQKKMGEQKISDQLKKQKKQSKIQIFQYKAGDQKYCNFEQGTQIYSIDQHLIVKCQNEDEINFFLVLLDTSLKIWRVDPSNRVGITKTQMMEIKKLNLRGNEKIYIKTTTQIFQISLNEKVLAKKKLEILQTQEKLLTFSPTYIKTKQFHPYLFVVSENQGLILFSIHKNKVEHIENFGKLINFFDIEFVSYATTTNIDFDDQINGVLQIVLLIKNQKQFIIQIFHRCYDNNTHSLHINKIYHNYVVNNRGNQFLQVEDEEQQIQENIHSIISTHHLRTISGVHNNLGIIQGRSKLIFYQYGIPRSVGPDVITNTQFIREENYINIVDFSDVVSSTQASEKRNYTKEEIQRKISSQNPLKNIDRKIVKINNLVRYALTLNNMIFVVQLDPRDLFHYQYVCNLNSMGKIIEEHKIINDVKFRMRSICQKSNPEEKDWVKGLKVLTFCNQEQTIQFKINFKNIQEQKDEKQHYMFKVFFTIFCILLMVVVCIFWQEIRKQGRRLAQIDKQRIRILENSKIDETFSKSEKSEN